MMNIIESRKAQKVALKCVAYENAAKKTHLIENESCLINFAFYGTGENLKIVYACNCSEVVKSTAKRGKEVITQAASFGLILKEKHFNDSF